MTKNSSSHIVPLVVSLVKILQAWYERLRSPEAARYLAEPKGLAMDFRMCLA